MRASVLFVALAALPAAAKPAEDAPRPHEVFPQLLADPRTTQLSASYYRLGGRDLMDLGLGHAWGLLRGRLPDPAWLAELDVEAMSYSRVKVGAGRNELEAVDFSGALPVSVRRGDVSFELSLRHQSSHLGDDYIRRTGDQGFRYSTTALRALAAVEPWESLRLYGGPELALLTTPSPRRLGARAGVEWRSPDLRWSRGAAVRAYAAEDLQAHARAEWNPTSRLAAGLEASGRETRRAVRGQFAYQAGRSAFGQFYRRAESRWDLTLAFEL